VPVWKVPDWKCNSLQVIPNDIALVLDVDVRHGADGNKSLPCAIPQNTPTVQTQSGKGRQYWFKADSSLRTHADHEARIDVLTGKTGIFAPPSKIDGGGEYLWLVPLTLETLKPLPTALLEYLRIRQQPKQPIKNVIHSCQYGMKNLQRISQKQKDRLFEALDRCKAATKGARSENDFRFVIFGLSCGLDEETLWGLCSDVGKFQEKGQSYFRFTVKNALRKLGL